MKILFVTDEAKRPATELTEAILLKACIEGNGIELERAAYANVSKSDSSDVVLLMGYDANGSWIRSRRPNAVIGVVDPRPRQRLDLEEVDFLLPNGYESWQQWRSFGLPQSVFFLNETSQPGSLPVARAQVQDGTLRFGYLGNSVHLRRLKQVASATFGEVSKTEKISFSLFLSENFRDKEMRWLPSEPNVFRIGRDSIDDFMSTVDIGLVPQIRPTDYFDRIMNFGRSFGKERGNIIDLSFKPTTNPGRLLTFAQFAKPSIVDSTPSVNQLIGDKYNNFLALDQKSWKCAIEHSIADKSAREDYGSHLQSVFALVAEPRIQVDRMIRVSNEIAARRRPSR